MGEAHRCGNLRAAIISMEEIQLCCFVFVKKYYDHEWFCVADMVIGWFIISTLMWVNWRSMSPDCLPLASFGWGEKGT